MGIYKTMETLGIALPNPPAKGGVYNPCKIFSGNLAYVSGCGPSIDGDAPQGKLGQDISLDQGKEYARRCMLNVLAVLEREIGDLHRVIAPVKLLVFVASDDAFTQQPQVANGASELLVSLFGESGAPARSAIGVNVLPGNIPVEIEALFEIATK